MSRVVTPVTTDDESGQALIEFALVVPLLLLILGGVVYCGIMVVYQEKLAIAGRHVARKMAIDSTQRGMTKGSAGPASATIRDQAMREAGVNGREIRASGVNWSALGRETGSRPGSIKKINGNTAVFQATRKGVSLKDLGGRTTGKPATMGIGVVLHGVTLTRDMKDLAGVGNLARINVPGISATSVMPAELPPRGERGVPGVLDMNPWIRDIVNEKYKGR
jgi:hypothetical protein